MKQKILFIDRDGTLILEQPPTYQIDCFSKLEFYPGAITWLARIASEMDFTLVMVSNQDGLGTDSFPENTFWPVQDFVIKTFENEGVIFSDVLLDRSFAHENKPGRKPGTAMLSAYLNSDQYDLANSFVIGDRITDVQLAQNLGCKAIYINTEEGLGAEELPDRAANLDSVIGLETSSWKDIYQYLKRPAREAVIHRITNETRIEGKVNLDGTGKANIDTGIPFFDHMLEQIARHGMLDLALICKGDLHIDEHHTIEDTGLALGEAVSRALGDKRGINRYGFLLPMDDCLAQVAIDFGGRPWIVWDVQFKREKVGAMPTEMVFHFFKSFSDAAKANVNVKAEGENEHHKIESIFKAFAKCIRMAVQRDSTNDALPSTKGIL